MLKNLLAGCIVVIGLNGCLSDKAYQSGKVVYTGAKSVYTELDNKSNKLKNLDKVIVTYDVVRTAVKEKIIKKK